MKNKIILTLIFIGWLLKVNGQYTLTAISPPPQFTHEDLWNLSLTRSNLNDGISQFLLGLRIYDNSYSLEMKANSSVFNINGNSMLINLSNLNSIKPFTIQYYNGTTLQSVISSGGLFPPGYYNIEFVLMGKPSDGEFVELANYTYQTMVDALWPPMLVNPVDKEILQTTSPTLMWTPAFSTNFSGTILYKLKIVEIKDGQSKEQAIKSNSEFYTKNGIIETFHPLPTPLDMEKTYAWMVEAYLNSLVLNSEVWEFSFEEVMQTKSLINTSNPDNEYADLSFDKPESAFVYVANNEKLKFRYFEEYNLPLTYQSLQYKIIDYKGNVVIQNQCSGVSPCNIGKGINYITINTNTLGLTLGNYYLLEVSNLKNEKWYLRFKI